MTQYTTKAQRIQVHTLARMRMTDERIAYETKLSLRQVRLNDLYIIPLTVSSPLGWISEKCARIPPEKIRPTAKNNAGNEGEACGVCTYRPVQPLHAPLGNSRSLGLGCFRGFDPGRVG